MEQNNQFENINVSAEAGAKKRGRAKRLLIALLTLLFFVGGALGVLQLGAVYAERSWIHWRPDYAKVDLLPILDKTELTEENYQTIYRQTGLTRLGVDGLLEKSGKDRILAMQEYYFKDHELIINNFNPFTYSEKIDDRAPMAILEDGDVLVTASTRVSWWRYGHAAIVVDGANGIIAESIAPGSVSDTDSADTFANLANFMILRPKADAETKAAVTGYIRENLLGLPYQMTTGIFTKKYPDVLKTSQCAHLVWYAYKRFGIDLDSNGGAVVKPQDIANSEYVEVVQTFGFDPDTLWS